MLFKKIDILDENFELKRNMYLGTRDGRIAYIGDSCPDDAASYEKDGSYEGKDLLLMPSFVNAHAHSAMTLMRGYGEGLQLQDWLTKKIFPFEDHLYDEAVYWASVLAIAESVASGIVSTSDMYYFCSNTARAVAESGVKMNISRAFVHFDESDPRATYRFKDMVDFIRGYDGYADGRVIAEACLHAEYTSNPEAARAVGEAAKEFGVGLQVHVSETKSEHEECKQRHGKTPVRYFRDLGMLDMRVTAAHCVWIEDEDIDIFKEKGVHVASCPVSNMKLASGIADILKIREKGVHVAIGTDSVSSNNNLNFFEEMKLFSLAAKIKSGNPAALSPKEVLMMATREGALAQGREDTGLIKEGYRADLLAIDTSKPCMQPIHDIATNLVYSADPSVVAMTISEGRLLYERGEFKTIDIERAIFETNAAKDKILGML